MNEKEKQLRYEELYNRLLSTGRDLHTGNKKRIRTGLIFLGIFTLAMIFIRWLTDSDRVVFMVIWVIGMFAISIYLISVEYIDDSIRKTLEDVTEREADFGELIPDSEQVREMIRDRARDHQHDIENRFTDHLKRTGSLPEEYKEESGGDQ